MDERYPYIRFVIDAAQVIAGAVALIVLLGGTVSSCHCGGFHGLVSFVVSVGIAALTYVVVMVCIEALRVLLDIESAARQTLAAQRPPAAPGSTA